MALTNPSNTNAIFGEVLARAMATANFGSTVRISAGAGSGALLCMVIGCDGLRRFVYLGSTASWVHVLERLAALWDGREWGSPSFPQTPTKDSAKDRLPSYGMQQASAAPLKLDSGTKRVISSFCSFRVMPREVVFPKHRKTSIRLFVALPDVGDLEAYNSAAAHYLAGEFSAAEAALGAAGRYEPEATEQPWGRFGDGLVEGASAREGGYAGCVPPQYQPPQGVHTGAAAVSAARHWRDPAGCDVWAQSHVDGLIRDSEIALQRHAAAPADDGLEPCHALPIFAYTYVIAEQI
eukprot:gene47441-28746_t